MPWVTILLSACGGLGGLSTFFLYLSTRGDRGIRKRQARIDDRVTAALVPVREDLASIHSALDTMADRNDHHLTNALHVALEPLRDQLVVLNTKIEPLWTSLINVGINQTEVLHQPDPRRAEIDTLLEALQVELRGGARMPSNDYLKLRKFLEKIKTWEPGQELGFPVLPAEPTSAAILLAIMGLSRIKRRQEN